MGEAGRVGWGSVVGWGGTGITSHSDECFELDLDYI